MLSFSGNTHTSPVTGMASNGVIAKAPSSPLSRAPTRLNRLGHNGGAVCCNPPALVGQGYASSIQVSLP